MLLRVHWCQGLGQISHSKRQMCPRIMSSCSPARAAGVGDVKTTEGSIRSTRSEAKEAGEKVGLPGLVLDAGLCARFSSGGSLREDNPNEEHTHNGARR